MSTAATEPAFLTVEEVAARLRVSPKSVYRYVAAGLPAIRLNETGPLRFDERELGHWLEENRAPAGREWRHERASAGRRTGPVAPPGPSPLPASGEPS